MTAWQASVWQTSDVFPCWWWKSRAWNDLNLRCEEMDRAYAQACEWLYRDDLAQKLDLYLQEERFKERRELQQGRMAMEMREWGYAFGDVRYLHEFGWDDRRGYGDEPEESTHEGTGMVGGCWKFMLYDRTRYRFRWHPNRWTAPWVATAYLEQLQRCPDGGPDLQVFRYSATGNGGAEAVDALIFSLGRYSRELTRALSIFDPETGYAKCSQLRRW